jgi:hypothetical protein
LQVGFHLLQAVEAPDDLGPLPGHPGLAQAAFYTVCQKSFPKCALGGDGFRILEKGVKGGN